MTPAQRLLRRGAARDVASRQARLPASRDLLEDSALVRRIAFHRLDQVGNEIRAALELHVHSAPGFAREVTQPHQPIEDEDNIKRDRGRHRDDDPVVHVRHASARRYVA
jgi:hypothetical protein